MFVPLVCLLLFVSFHFGLALPLTDSLFIPQVALLPLAGLMLLRRPNPRIVIGAILASLALICWVLMLSSDTSIPLLRRLVSGIQLIYILTVAALVSSSRPLDPDQARQAAWYCQIISAAVVLFGVLEILTPLKTLSDAFRERIYSDVIYTADVRDLAMAGFLRPKVFASEPSHAVWGICLMLLCAAAFAPTRRTVVASLCILGAATPIFFSPNAPITAVFVCLLAVILFWDRRKLVSALASTIVLGACAVAFGYFLLTTLLAGRFSQLTGYEGSFFIRIVQPFSMAATALKFNWLVGVGFGGLESIWTDIIQIEGGSSTENLNRTTGMALLSIPLFAGVSGVCFFLGLLAWIIRRYPGRIGSAIVAVLVFTLLQKQSFVITTAWIVAAVWAMQAQASLTYNHAPSPLPPSEHRNKSLRRPSA